MSKEWKVLLKWNICTSFQNVLFCIYFRYYQNLYFTESIILPCLSSDIQHIAKCLNLSETSILSHTIFLYNEQIFEKINVVNFEFHVKQQLY
jgi:hypothetical protein